MKITNIIFAASCFLIFFAVLTIYGQRNDVALSGFVEQIIVEENQARYEYVLVSEAGRRYRLSASKSLSNYANRRISLMGGLAGNRLSIKSDIRVLDENNTLPPPPTFGSRKVLVLLVKFIDNPTPPESVEDARAQIFTGERSVNGFVKAASLNRYSLTGLMRPDGDITDWMTLPISWQGCDVYGQWTEDADALARQNGYEPNNYNSVVYVFPSLCGQNPSATVGFLGGTTRREKIWIRSGHLTGFDVITHELGHNLGLLHANGIRCSGAFIPVVCQQQEYGDPYDTMGTAVSTFFFNNNFRLSLGWLTGRSPEITESGDYRLFAPSAPAKRNQVLRIPLKNQNGELTGFSYYLEFRRPFGFDNQLTPTYQPLFNGVGIRYSTTGLLGDATLLVDTTPNTPSFADAPLTVGNTYNDTQHGVRITTLSTNPQFGAHVRIELSR